jgi:hypothetical protein
LRSVHANVFSVTPLEIIRNVLDAGMVKQPDRVVRTPMLMDQKPPGVFGWFVGNPRIWIGAQVESQVVFSTSSVAEEKRGSTPDEHAKSERRKTIPAYFISDSS